MYVGYHKFEEIYFNWLQVWREGGINLPGVLNRNNTVCSVGTQEGFEILPGVYNNQHYTVFFSISTNSLQ